MIRFIDLKDQICEGTREFAWYDTVRDEFFGFPNAYTWESWEDFEEDFKANKCDWDIERFRGLFHQDFSPSKG
jgi:hypothetical protein